MKDCLPTNTCHKMPPVRTTVAEGGMCMLGSITTQERCPQCGAKMEDNGFTAVSCKKHPEEIARHLRVRFKFKGDATQKKFTGKTGLEGYRMARRFLDGIRYKCDEGIFDHRDYKSSNPLGFTNLINQWLEIKQRELKANSFLPLKRYARYASKIWGNRNIKEIDFGAIEDFLTITLEGLSSKSRANAKSALHTFFTWCRRRKIISSDQFPEFPGIDVSMRLRKMLDKESQLAVLEHLREISWDVNPRIWMAVKWLSTYFSIRPCEMLSLKERNIDIKIGVIYIEAPNDKTGAGRIIELLPEDIDLIQTLTRSFPDLPFFRHLRGYGGPGKTKAGDQFHHNYIYRWWKRACADLGVTDVALYPGTKHSSVSALGEMFTPEQIKKASQISTNKAFERYFRPNPKLIRSVYSAARGGDTEGTPKVIEIKPPKSRS